MDDLEVARDLRGAAEYLRTYGWRQNGFGPHGGARCLAGAISSATSLSFLGFPPFDPFAVTSWNDEPGRTLEEVTDRLESTALALEVRALSHETTAPEPRVVVAVA